MNDEGTNSHFKIFANIFISFIGAGILGLPYAFKEAGLIEGIVIMTVVGAISVKAMLLLIDCKDRIILQTSISSVLNGVEKGRKKLSNGSASPVNNGHGSSYIDYGDVGYAALGSSGKVLVDISIIISQVGFCCAYLIFIVDNLHSIYPRIPRLGYLFSLLIPLIFLTNLRHLNHLAPFSVFANFSTVFAYGIVFYFDLEHFHLIHFHIQNFSLEGLPFYLGVAIYCYEGAGLILSLEASVAKELRGSFRRIFKFSIVCTTLLYIVFGVCGYLSFGPDTDSIITLNLPSGLFPFMVKGCLCFSLFFTYPIMMFPVAKILEKKLCQSVQSPDDLEFHNKSGFDTNYIMGCILRTLLVLLTGLIMVCVPDFSTIMALVGSSCCTLLAFILPGIFHWKLFKTEASYWSRILDVFLILLGIVGAIIGTQDALARMYNVDKTTSPLVLINTTATVDTPTPTNPS